MVQELAFDNYTSSMFPSRPPPQPSTYNHMNHMAPATTSFGYPTAPPGSSQQTQGYGPHDGYGQFQMMDPSAGFQHGGPGAWPGVYGTATPPAGPGAVPAGRPGSTPATDLDWFGAAQTSLGLPASQAGSSPIPGYNTQGYRLPGGGNLPTGNLSTELSPSYSTQAPSHSPGSMQGLPHGHSPSPNGHDAGLPGTPGAGPAGQRQTARPPYDWMKKQAYPVAQSSGKRGTTNSSLYRAFGSLLEDSLYIYDNIS